MENTRLATLLDTLSSSEKVNFRRWLASPYHNQRADLTALFELYETCRREGKALPDKTIIFEKLFPGEPFDDHRVRLAMSLLLRQAEDFLCVEIFFEDKLRIEIRQLELYRRRNLPDHFQRNLLEARALNEKQPHRHPAWLWQGFELELESYLFQASANRTAELNLQQTGDQLDLAFMALKLRQSCVALSHQAVFRADYDFGLLPQVLAAVEAKNLLEVPAIAVYFHCYRALANPTENVHFQEFKKMLFHHVGVFPPDEMRDLYLLAINFCIQRYNQGDRRFLEEEMELYRRGLSEKVLFTGGHISRFTYRNVVSLGLTLGQFDETERFVHEYRPHLEPRHREANFSFNLARLEYERGRFDRALELLQKSDYEDLLLNLAAKALLLKIYFETDADVALDSHLDAMSNFVRRKKELNYHRDNYLNLCRFARKIRSLRASDTAGREALRRDIEGTPNVAYRDWLLEKLGG